MNIETFLSFDVVFLAGGTGRRLGGSIPKQYLRVHHKPLALYSFEALTSLPEVQNVVVVCQPQYDSLFQNSAEGRDVNLRFARPGVRRQDSVFNGIEQLSNNPLVCIHDSARPLIKPSLVRQVVRAAATWGAAVVGVKVKSTIKRCDASQFVIDTLQRDLLWEAQTPQVIRLALLREGFSHAEQSQFTVTDDVSLVERLGKEVKFVEGSYDNIKVTTREDLVCVEKLIPYLKKELPKIYQIH